MDNAVKLNSNILIYYKIYLNIISNIFCNGHLHSQMRYLLI